MTRFNESIRAGVLALLALMALASGARAKTTLDIEPGYDGRFRAGRWSPVFVEVRSDRPRSAIIELRVPNASSSALTIRQAIGVGTDRQKYVLYAPLAMMHDPLQARLFDADSGSLLAEWPDRDRPGNLDRGGEQVGFLVATSGRSTVMQGFRRNNSVGSTIISHLRPELLPASPIGYDAADMLVLNNPEWSRLATEQQRAMIDWARAGGTILLCPGVDPIPPDAPLAGVLPCEVGDSGLIQLNPSQRRALGLGERFASIAHRPLTPRAGATRINLPEDIASGVARRFGLGQIVVLPIEPASLQFDRGEQFQTFWNTLFDRFLGEKPKADENNNTYYNYNDTDIAAANAALERIGQIPNTGSFGFAYIAIVIGGLMLIVGPIDWLVLKKIGKQPWTWATTLGWIGVVTCGAVYAGHLLRSGELHFRTLRIFEQAGDRVVSMEDVALVYAPRSATYSIKSDPNTWWQPVPSGYRFSSSSTLATPLRAWQTYRGNLPEPMWIDIWNWRFLHGTRYVDEPALIRASLRVTSDRITGSITNLSPHTLKQILLFTGQRGVDISVQIGPNATAQVDARLQGYVDNNAPSPRLPFTARPPVNTGELGPESRHLLSSPYFTIFNLSPARGSAIERLSRSGNIILYATLDGATTDVGIDSPTALSQHTGMLRAVIEPDEAKQP